MRRGPTLIMLMVCILAIAGWYILNAGRPQSVVGDRSHWETRIQAIGGQKAYKEFLSDTADLSAQERHVPGHLFGGALFRVEGLAGMPVCTEEASGCLHQFIEEAVYTNGIGAIRDLERACNRSHQQVEALRDSWLNYVPCGHSLGHGIVATLGYSAESLPKALEVCRGLEHFEPVLGCERGVFMEYNLRTFLGTAAAREVTPDTYAGACEKILTEHQSGCLYSLPQWWMNALNPDNPLTDDMVRTFGRQCRTAGGTNAIHCFEGLGLAFALMAPPDTTLIAKLCATASRTDAEAYACKSHAAFWLAYTIKAELENPLRPEAICQDLTGEAHAYCIRMATQSVSASDFTSPPPLDP